MVLVLTMALCGCAGSRPQDVCAMDRRGHGSSGDSPDYSLQKEAEDVAAAVDSRRGPVAVLGHSYGGVAALEAAFLTRNISKLILYEAPLQEPIDLDVIEKIEKLIEKGDRDQVATIGSQPRQMRALAAYRFDPTRISAVRIPTLLLTGGSSTSPSIQRAIRSLQASLAHSTLVVLEGQQHNAMDSGRDQLARAITSFLLGFFIPPLLHSQDSVTAPMAGISNQGRNGTEPYVTAGDRAYLIGTQDGNFPDLGDHLPGEMGGLWVHPIKLIDGFWATVTDRTTGRDTALSPAIEFINYPYGNRLRYGPVLDSLDVERFQFSPDGHRGVIVEYTFANRSDRRRELTFQLSVKTELLPVWFSERLGITDAPDTADWDANGHRFVARDTRHPWFAVWGASPTAAGEPVTNPNPIHTSGMGVSAASRYSVSVEPHASSTLRFVFAGSATSRKAAEDAYSFLIQHESRLLAKKKARYQALLGRARISIPDHRLQQVYDWVKVNAEWLVRDVPGVGRGLSGGFMEYPWWFGTETYSLQAMLGAGNPALAKQTLRLLRDQSAKANGNGRIVHEVTTNGAVSNPGNTQETAQFILTVGKVVQWTGDLAFAREMYPAMKQGIHWLLTDMDRNRNLFPEGYGITEILGLNAELIDVAVYTQQALAATARVGRILGEPKAAAGYERQAAELARRIEERFWIPEESSYADFYGTRTQAMSTAEGAVKQINLKGADKLTPRDRELIGYYEGLRAKFSAMPDSSRGWITNKNWVIETPVEMGIAPRARAIEALDRIRKDNVGEYGPYLSAVDKQAMMTISTGVAAVSEANYGRTDDALWYMGKIVETFNRKLPGSISEMMPDYGCFAIAWTSYGIVLPLVQHVFGIEPDAVHKTVVFTPHLPTGWENISIDDLPVGSNLVSFSRAKTEKGIEYRVGAKESGWTFVLKENVLPKAKYYLNGRPVALAAPGIRMSGQRNRLLVVSN